MKRSVKLLLLLFCLLVVACSACACAEEPEKRDPLFTYTMGHDGTYLILTRVERARGHVVIPDTHEGYPVTAIGRTAFSDCNKMTGVTLPEGLTSIGDAAFDGCTALTEITIPAGVTAIGIQTFFQCSALETVRFAEGSVLAEISTQAFGCCVSLRELSLPASVERIGTSAFSGCTALERLIMAPENRLCNVDRNAFSGCDKLIEREGGLVYVADWIISCDEPYIEEIVWREGTAGIAADAFHGLNTLCEVEIPATVQGIGHGAFAGCGLEKLTFAEGSRLRFIGERAIGCSAEELVIPASVEYIGWWAFAFCPRLRYVTFEQPDGWQISLQYDGSDRFPVDLSDPQANDDYLLHLYKEYIWRRE